MEQVATSAMRRNSSIELLRIISMLMIIGFHILRNPLAEALKAMPICTSKFILQNVFLNAGWIGNCIFFAISAWFFAEREQSFRSCLRRAWLLEREVLFWSLMIFAFAAVTGLSSTYISDTRGLLFDSVLPLSTDLWWYPTSYVIFLLLLPFLQHGLKILGKKEHGHLALLMLALWGIGGLVYHVQFDIASASVFVLIYWYVLITYYRWYMDSFSSKCCWGMIGAGFAIDVLYWSSTNLMSLKGNHPTELQLFIFDSWKLPSMLIGFGIFLLCEKKSFHSTIINLIASTTFGVYLIHYHPVVFSWWTGVLHAQDLFAGNYAIGILKLCIIILMVFGICMLCDLCRQLIFRFTIDKYRGRMFDKIWTQRHKFKNCKFLSASTLLLVLVVYAGFAVVV